jgi:Tfp pilus assembly protein PilV
MGVCRCCPIKARPQPVDGERVRPARAQSPPASEAGFALIEVLVSALIVVIAGGAVLTTLQATARSAGDSRHRSMAQAIAQEDQARLRSMRISSLNKLNQNYPVTLDGTTFSVTSTGVFVNNTSQTASCTSGQTSADYIRISSSVTWPGLGARPATTVQSIVSPSNGSLDPGHGTLTFSAINAAGLPLPGVGFSGTGAGTFSGTSDASGCANFADLPAGNYTVTPSAPGLVDKLGNAPATLNPSPGVAPSNTNTAQVQYDIPGTLEVDFKYRVGSSAEFKSSNQRSIAIFNSGTGQLSPTFVSAAGSNPVAAIKSGSLFPFTSNYAVYAGSCTENNPNPESNPQAPGAGAVTGIGVTPGGTHKGTIHLPALNLLVKKSGTPVEAKVRITGTCSFTRDYTMTTGSTLDVGLPWGTYNACAQTVSGTIVRKTLPASVAVQNLAAATSKEIDLGSGTSSGACP